MKIKRIKKTAGFKIKNKVSVVYEALNDLAADLKVPCPSPQQIIEAAMDPQHVLHDEFEWDDTKAARLYRLEQARYLVRAIKVEYEQAALHPEKDVRIITTRAFSHTKSGGYRPTLEVLEDDELRKELLDNALRALKQFTAKYAILTELSELIPEMEAIIKRHKVS